VHLPLPVFHSAPKDEYEEQPIIAAALAGKIDVVETLHRLGASVNTRNNVRASLKWSLICSQFGATPFYGAAETGHIGVLRTLLRLNADPLVTTQVG
jgi:ankyrin repeat protein